MLEELRRNYNQVQTKLSQVYDDLLGGLINAELCRQKMTELEEQQQGIKAGIEGLERETHKVIPDGLDILDLGEQVARKVEGFSLEQKRNLLRVMMEDAVAKDGKINYKIVVPINLFFELWKGKRPSPNEIINYPFVYHILHNSVAPELETLRAILS